MQKEYFNLSDSELVNAARNNSDQKAFEALYLRYQHQVRNAAIMFSLQNNKPCSSSEAISESFIAFHKIVHSIENANDFKEHLSAAIFSHLSRVYSNQ